MKKKKAFESFPASAALIFFVLAGYLHTVKSSVPRINTMLFISITFIYLGLILSWSVYVDKRFISDRIRKMLVSMAAFLLFYILIRTVKYRYVRNDYYTISRYLWYCYYLPQIFAPLISFMTACTVGNPEDKKLSKHWIFVFIAAFLLAAGIMTNDFHRLAFRFNENMLNWEIDYSYGFLFYTVTGWIYFFIFASVFMLWHKCRVSSIKRNTWIPLVFLPVGTIMVIMLAIENVTGVESIFELPEIHCFILIAIWESCIKIGLIPCNSGYSEYFTNSSLSAQIADAENNVVFRSKSAADITKKQMEQAKKAPVLISKNTVLHSNAVCGGNVFWTEDLTAVNKMNRELREIGERLSEESELLRAENEIKEQRARIEEQNRLYDSIAVLLKPQLDEIARLLESEADFDEKIRLVCVLNCYVKRRANLALLSDSCRYIDSRELYLSIRESVEYIKLCGASGFVSFSGDCTALSEHILLAFDIWQCWVEASLNTLNAVMANIYAEEGSVLIKLSFDGVCDFPSDEVTGEKLSLCGGKMSVKQEDGTVFVRLFIPRGGEKR